VNKDGEDYNLISTWIGAVDDVGSITVATTMVFSHGGISGAVADRATVTGTVSGTTATVAHATATQILVYGISGAGFQSGEGMQVSVGNSVTLSDTGDSCNLVCWVSGDQGEIAQTGFSISVAASTVNFVRIEAPPDVYVGKRYGDGTGPQISLSGAISITSANTKLNRLSFAGTNISLSAPACRISQCIFSGGFTAITCIPATSRSYYIYNNLFYGQTGNAVLLNTLTGRYTNINFNVCNNTLQSRIYCNIYTVLSTGNANIRNNLSIDVFNSCYAITATSKNFTNNGSSDTTGNVGLQNLTSSEFISVVPGSEDYHLSSSAYSIDKGTDLGVSYLAIDIDGRDRDASEDIWDLGCDEYVAPSTSIKPQVIITNIM